MNTARRENRLGVAGRERKQGNTAVPSQSSLACSSGRCSTASVDRLGEPELLESAIDGFTQNANESFHHLLWDFCPKTVFTSSTIVAIAAGLAVLQFNKGNIALSHLLR